MKQCQIAYYCRRKHYQYCSCNRSFKSTVNRLKRQVNPNYTRESASRRSLVPASTHNIVRLKLRSGQLRCVDHVQSYLRSIGHFSGFCTTHNLSRQLFFIWKKKTTTAALNIIQRRQRYQWAWKHHHWNVENLQKVIFSGESRINLWCSEGVKYTYRYKGNSKSPFNHKSKGKREYGSMKVWG